MIHVKWRDEELGRVWDATKAADLQRKLDACSSPEEKADFLKRNDDWTELLGLFERWSYGKCWYTEAKPSKHTGPFEIDHFRPKSAACDPWNNREWDGYPWLAYDPRNCRLAGRSANVFGRDVDGRSAGKGTRFPLETAESPIAKCRGQLAVESPHVLLIDPLDADAVTDVSFNEEGVATCTASNDDFRRERVARTVSVFNLDHPGLIEARQDVWRQCEKIVQQINRLEPLAKVAPALREEVRLAREELRALRRADAEFAGTARAYCRTRGVAWVQMLGQIDDPPELPPFDLDKPADNDGPAAAKRPAVRAQLMFDFMNEAVAESEAPPTKESRATAAVAERRAKQGSGGSGENSHRQRNCR